LASGSSTASSYPVWIHAPGGPQRVTYEVRETNVHPIVSGSVDRFRSIFTHYSFNSGLKRWFQKHNSTARARRWRA